MSKAKHGIQDSGERTEFSTGAVRDMHAGKGRFDLLPWHAIHDVAKHCEEGAIKYGERNVDKGIPQHSLVDSAFRHLKKYWTGETDEPHLRAAAWNILWALEQETTHPGLVDIPVKPRKVDDDVNEAYIRGFNAGILECFTHAFAALDIDQIEAKNGRRNAEVKKYD